MTRPVVHGLRYEYQDRINFVILDYDIRAQRDFAGEMAAARHPAFVVIPPNSGPDQATARTFGPLNEEGLRAYLDEAIATYSS